MILLIAMVAVPAVVYSYVLHVHFEFWRFCKEVKDGMDKN